MYYWGHPLEKNEMSSTKWKMPRPNVGDIVLFSKDIANFTDPVVGFVAAEPGDTTISILTFSPTGYALVHNSCHHKDDPALSGDHGWDDLGVWEFAPATQTIRDLMDTGNTSGRKPANK